MAVATTGPRMGLEIEYHQIELRWKSTPTDGSKPMLFPGLGNVDVDDKSIPIVPVYGQAIFIPQDTTEFGTEDSINWEGLWGFQMVSDFVAMK